MSNSCCYCDAVLTEQEKYPTYDNGLHIDCADPETKRRLGLVTDVVCCSKCFDMITVANKAFMDIIKNPNNDVLFDDAVSKLEGVVNNIKNRKADIVKFYTLQKQRRRGTAGLEDYANKFCKYDDETLNQESLKNIKTVLNEYKNIDALFTREQVDKIRDKYYLTMFEINFIFRETERYSGTFVIRKDITNDQLKWLAVHNRAQI